MSFFKNIFSKKEETIESYADFWHWFQSNENEFRKIVKNGNAIEKKFFAKLEPKLNAIKENIYFLTGMFDNTTAELILTADGNTKTIAFVEELIEAAPEIQGWKFTALKAAMNSDDFKIDMDGFTFDKENIFFYDNDYPDFPDEIDLDFIHNDYTEEDRTSIGNGIYIFLDNYLGELDLINQIDSLQIVGKENAKKELIPISKLKDYLIWRQKEFVEKYQGKRYDTAEDTYAIFEAKNPEGNALIGVINTELLKWDAKASHSWLATMTIFFDGKENNGMPNTTDYETLNLLEEEILGKLNDIEGFLYLGRETGNNERNIYFACIDFRKPSKVFYEIQKKYSANYEIEYTIFKDKYWLTLERYKQN